MNIRIQKILREKNRWFVIKDGVLVNVEDAYDIESNGDVVVTVEQEPIQLIKEMPFGVGHKYVMQEAIRSRGLRRTGTLTSEEFAKYAVVAGLDISVLEGTLRNDEKRAKFGEHYGTQGPVTKVNAPVKQEQPDTGRILVKEPSLPAGPTPEHRKAAVGLIGSLLGKRH